MSLEEGSVEDWLKELQRKDKQAGLTRDEARDLVLFSINFHMETLTKRMEPLLDATEHQEGMLGAIDVFVFEVARRMGIPYPSSAKIRAALDKVRDEQRKLNNGSVQVPSSPSLDTGEES